MARFGPIAPAQGVECELPLVGGRVVEHRRGASVAITMSCRWLRLGWGIPVVEHVQEAVPQPIEALRGRLDERSWWQSGVMRE